MDIRRLNREEMDNIIDNLPKDKNNPHDKNNRFLREEHKLWIRLFNYDKEMSYPFCFFDDDKLVSVIYATYNKNKYVNVYTIVTISGCEGKGYAKKLWEYLILDAYKNGQNRLKISCSLSSVSWYIPLGLVFWGIDKTGSLKSDQPLFPTIQEQIQYAERLKNSDELFPSQKVIEEFKSSQLDCFNFSEKKRNSIRETIDFVGDRWMGDRLIKIKDSYEINMSDWI